VSFSAVSPLGALLGALLGATTPRRLYRRHSPVMGRDQPALRCKSARPFRHIGRHAREQPKRSPLVGASIGRLPRRQGREMECGNDLLLAGVGYLAINMARWRKRRPDGNKLYLDVLSGIVIRDGRAFTPTKQKSRKQKHFARSAHLHAPLVRDSCVFVHSLFFRRSHTS
jgi:hypothetical protein